MRRTCARLVMMSALLATAGCPKDECERDADCAEGFRCTNIGECRQLTTGSTLPGTPVPDSGASNADATSTDGATGSADSGSTMADSGTTIDTGSTMPTDTGVGLDAMVDAGIPAGDYDPARVYLFGYFRGNVGNAELALQDLSNTGAPPRVGFSGPAVSPSIATITPTGGYLLYVSAREVRSMIPDTFAGNYPLNGTSNDPPYPIPACGGARATSLASSPDDSVYYACFLDPRLHGPSGPAGFNSDDLLAWGANGVALVRPTGSSTSTPVAVRNAAGNLASVAPLTVGTVLAARARNDGFWVATSNQLWTVGPTGTATVTGTFAPSPGTSIATAPYRLDGAGDLIHLAATCSTCDASQVVRRVLDGAATVILDDTSNPEVRVSGLGSLVTGP